MGNCTKYILNPDIRNRKVGGAVYSCNRQNTFKENLLFQKPENCRNNCGSGVFINERVGENKR